MERPYLKERLLYAPKKGVFYWIKPPAAHSELLGEEAGAVARNRSGKSYHLIQIDGRKYKRSRLAFLYMVGRWPEGVVDHIDGNSTDDRWANLREATVQQNAYNRRPHKKSSSLPMGVRQTASGRFAARIGVDGKQISLGTFGCAQDAARAYQQAKEKYYGEFA